MNILFLARRRWPEIGGVERHIFELSKVLGKKGHTIKIVSAKEIKYPKIKILGLIYIWLWLFLNRSLIEKADVIHCHDVFIWYLPFRFIYPKKSVFVTIHGLEWDKPLRKMSLFQKRAAIKLSSGSIGIGRFLEKYIGMKFSLVSYGAVFKSHKKISKNNHQIVYVGRLEENTGLQKFLNQIKTGDNNTKIDFIGDGRLRKLCEKYGRVHGFTCPTPYYIKSRYCVPGGYLSALEALSYGCELRLYWDNKVKRDFWKMSPFMKNNVRKWAVKQTWERLAEEYITLWTKI